MRAGADLPWVQDKGSEFVALAVHLSREVMCCSLACAICDHGERHLFHGRNAGYRSANQNKARAVARFEERLDSLEEAQRTHGIDVKHVAEILRLDLRDAPVDLAYTSVGDDNVQLLDPMLGSDELDDILGVGIRSRLDLGGDELAAGTSRQFGQ